MTEIFRRVPLCGPAWVLGLTLSLAPLGAWAVSPEQDGRIETPALAQPAEMLEPTEQLDQIEQDADSTAAVVPEPTAGSEGKPSAEVAPQRGPVAKPVPQGPTKPAPQESIVITRGPATGTLGSGQAQVGSGSTLFSVMLALVAVVVMILATAWFIKRFTGLSALNNRQIKVLATLPVGARERVVLVEVGQQQLLLGITPQQINTLHAFKEPVVIPDKPGATDFAQRLQAILSKGNP